MKLYNYQRFNESTGHDSIYRIRNICQKYNIQNYTINDDGSIDVDGDVYLQFYHLSRIPLKFNHVSGYFNCGSNIISSLEGCPKYVGGYFNCSSNRIRSLEFAPSFVGNNFNCSFNGLTSLVGCPKTIIGDFYAINNNLTDFKGFPEFYQGGVDFYKNLVDQILLFKPIIKYKTCKFIHLLNEYDVIRKDRIIIRDRLEAAWEGVGIELPDYINIYGYEII